MLFNQAVHSEILPKQTTNPDKETSIAKSGQVPRCPETLRSQVHQMLFKCPSSALNFLQVSNKDSNQQIAYIHNRYKIFKAVEST